MLTGLLLSVLALFCGSLTEEQPATGELAVMTFNLRYASDRQPNSWAARRDVMAELIRREQPDLIGTQEGLFGQLTDLENALPEYRWLGQGRDGGSHGEFMAIFYRRDRFDVLEYDHFWLSETPRLVGSLSYDADLPRMLTWVVFRDRRTDRRFYLLNTHFDHAHQNAREQSARQVLDWVGKLETESPVLLVGDFNAAAGRNPAYDILVGEGRFRDSWPAARERGEEIGTFHGFSGEPSDRGRIDWILFRGAITVSRTEIVTHRRDGQYPSDHFPVVARLALD